MEKSISKLHGNLKGLKAAQTKRLENIYRRKIPSGLIITPELGRYIIDLSRELGRQIGLIIDRRGVVQYVIVGDNRKVFIPDLSRHRAGSGRFRGLRLVHTHLKGEKLTNDDHTDLALLRLDMISAIAFDTDGNHPMVYSSHLMPENEDNNIWYDLESEPLHSIGDRFGFIEFISELEDEYRRKQPFRKADKGQERTILVSVSLDPDYLTRESMDELEKLAETAGLLVLDRVVQKPRKINPKSLIGKGKLENLLLSSMQLGCDLLVFDQNLSPSQIRYITDMTELKVVDRTQLILDIFSQHADTPDGKIQVELAQLKYMLPRLVGKNTAMSRLEGGIGGRGPGETKLEVDRRKVRDRISKLERDIIKLAKQRQQRRSLRQRRGIPVISIVGYTNAGKSTLLNGLTNSKVYVKDQLFATLDTHSKRLRFPREREVIITDTVGFIKDLPQDILNAFRATLEELRDADLLLHVIDLSNPRYRKQKVIVEEVVESLGLGDIPVLNVYNKIDLVSTDGLADAPLDGVRVSARKKDTFPPLLKEMESAIWGH